MHHTTSEEVDEYKGCTIYLFERIQVIGRIDHCVESFYLVDDNEEAFEDVDAARNWIDDVVTLTDPRTGT
jgi:hypothetical protein